MFVHHVIFWLKEPENQDSIKKFYSEIQELRKIETLDSCIIGTPAHTPREVVDNSYQFSLMTVFKSKKDHDIYQAHPIHKTFIEKCSVLWDRVLIYDAIE